MSSATNRRLFSLLLLAGLVLSTGLASWAAGAPFRGATLPTATPAARTTVANMPISFCLLPPDQAAALPASALTVGLMPGKGRTYSQVLVANQGTFQVDPRGLLTFSPAPDFTGTAQITYALRDNAGHLSAPAIITVFVEPAASAAASTVRIPTSLPGASLTLYPNPADGYVSLDLRPVAGGTYEAVIYDATGQRAMCQAVAGGAVGVLPVASLAAGHYRVEVCGATTTGTPLRLSNALVKQ